MRGQSMRRASLVAQIFNLHYAGDKTYFPSSPLKYARISSGSALL
jgi:hypothetical protein